MDEAKPTPPECEQPWVDNLHDLVQFADRGIVSKTLVDCPKSNVSLFAMRTGEKMSGHASRWPATIQVLSGAGTIQVGDTAYEARPGLLIYMPAKTYHALTSTCDLVFLLTLFR